MSILKVKEISKEVDKTILDNNKSNNFLKEVFTQMSIDIENSKN